MFGPEHITNPHLFQWQDGKQVGVWPDGRAPSSGMATMMEKKGVETDGMEEL